MQLFPFFISNTFDSVEYAVNNASKKCASLENSEDSYKCRNLD